MPLSRRAVKAFTFALLFLSMTVGCNDIAKTLGYIPAKAPEPQQPLGTGPVTESKSASRFLFPAQSGTFPGASVALDSQTGQLCKTFRWPDSPKYPSGLPLCAELTGSESASAIGAHKEYLGFTYLFNGTKWIKGSKAMKYNPQTQDMDPNSDDQYDPLGLFSKAEKANRVLTEEQIRQVANQFGVTYDAAWQDAKEQGYQVPQKPPAAIESRGTGPGKTPPRPSNVPANYIYKADGPKGRGWYKP